MQIKVYRLIQNIDSHYSHKQAPCDMHVLSLAAAIYTKKHLPIRIWCIISSSSSEQISNGRHTRIAMLQFMHSFQLPLKIGNMLH